MNSKPELLYLDLLKKTLSFTLWSEPSVPIMMFNDGRSLLKRRLIAGVSKALSSRGLALVQERTISENQRSAGDVYPIYADTMIGLKRLDNLQFCIESVLRDGVVGDLIETGVWRGGATIFMRAVLAAYGVTDRRVFVADSFDGLPKPKDSKYPEDAGDIHHLNRYLAVSKEEVARNFSKYDLLDEQVVFLKGWFKDTLPAAPISKLAILRLDGDMYGSTMDALECLYPKLSINGYVIIDDYHILGCRKAVDEFRARNTIKSPLVMIDGQGRYWKKY